MDETSKPVLSEEALRIINSLIHNKTTSARLLQRIFTDVDLMNALVNDPNDALTTIIDYAKVLKSASETVEVAVLTNPETTLASLTELNRQSFELLTKIEEIVNRLSNQAVRSIN